jgi:hypothetical protein
VIINRYVGSLFLKASSKPSDIVQKLNEIAGFQPDEDIELYEVRLEVIRTVVDSFPCKKSVGSMITYSYTFVGNKISANCYV